MMHILEDLLEIAIECGKALFVIVALSCVAGILFGNLVLASCDIIKPNPVPAEVSR